MKKGAGWAPGPFLKIHALYVGNVLQILRFRLERPNPPSPFQASVNSILLYKKGRGISSNYLYSILYICIYAKY